MQETGRAGREGQRAECIICNRISWYQTCLAYIACSLQNKFGAQASPIDASI